MKDQAPTVGLAEPVRFDVEFKDSRSTDKRPRTLVIRDVGGASRFRESWPAAIKTCHAVIFVIDSTSVDNNTHIPA